MTRTYKRSDTFPYFEQTLGYNLTDATVWFRLEEPDGEYLTVNARAEKRNRIRGIVRYEWGSGDLHKAGTYLGEFLIEWPDGRQRHVPSGDQYYRIEVGEPITGELDPEQWANQPIAVTIATVDELRGHGSEPIQLTSHVEANGSDLTGLGTTETTRLKIAGAELYLSDVEPTEPDDGDIWIAKE